MCKNYWWFQTVTVQKVITKPGIWRLSNFIVLNIWIKSPTTVDCNSKEQTPYSSFSCFEHKAWKIYLKSTFPNDYMLAGAQEQTCPHLSRVVSGDRQSTSVVHLGRAVEHCSCGNASWSLDVSTFGRLIMTSYLNQGHFIGSIIQASSGLGPLGK